MGQVPYQIAQNDNLTINLPQPLMILGGDNPTPFYLHFPSLPSGLQWVFPFTYGFAFPLADGAPINVTTRDTPPGWPPAPTSTAIATLVAYDWASLPFSTGIRPAATLGWTAVGSKTLVNSNPDSITTNTVPPTTRSLILVTGSGAGGMRGAASLFLQGLTTLAAYAGAPGGSTASLQGVYVFPVNGQADSIYKFSFADGGGFNCSVYASDAQAPGISQGQQVSNYSIPVVLASDQPATTAFPLITIPSQAEGSNALSVTQGFRKATFTVDANAIGTGALTANTDKQLLSIEHGAGSTRTVRIKRIILNAFIGTAGAAAGGIKFYIYTGTAASSAGTTVASRSNNALIGAVEATVKTLPTIVAATGPKCIHGTWAPAVVGPLSETTDIVLYEYSLETEELTLNAGSLQGLVIVVQAVSTPALTVFISMEFTEE